MKAWDLRIHLQPSYLSFKALDIMREYLQDVHTCTMQAFRNAPASSTYDHHDPDRPGQWFAFMGV